MRGGAPSQDRPCRRLRSGSAASRTGSSGRLALGALGCTSCPSRGLSYWARSIVLLFLSGELLLGKLSETVVVVGNAPHDRPGFFVCHFGGLHSPALRARRAHRDRSPTIHRRPSGAAASRQKMRPTTTPFSKATQASVAAGPIAVARSWRTPPSSLAALEDQRSYRL
jgi:hypothetical protein